MIAADQPDTLDANQLRELVERLRAEVLHKQAVIDKLTHENAVLKRLKFAAQSERFNAEQRNLLDETLDADLEAVAREIEALAPQAAPPAQRQPPKRQPLPAQLPRREIRHEPESTTCGCGCQMKRIGEDVSEKLDYQPGVFTVERHVRGKWVCAHCETLIQAPVAPHVIDKGIPTAGLLAQVLVAKYLDHLPLYRHEAIFGRAGLALHRSTLGAWAKWEKLVQAPVMPHVNDKGLATTGLLAQVLVAKYADHLPLYRQEESLLAPALRSRARPWRSGWAPAACSCSRWSMP